MLLLLGAPESYRCSAQPSRVGTRHNSKRNKPTISGNQWSIWPRSHCQTLPRQSQGSQSVSQSLQAQCSPVSMVAQVQLPQQFLDSSLHSRGCNPPQAGVQPQRLPSSQLEGEGRLLGAVPQVGFGLGECMSGGVAADEGLPRVGRLLA